MSTTPAPTSERTAMLDRLYEQIVAQTDRFASDTDIESWANVPIDTDVMFLGTRVNRITVGALLRHLGTAESHWLGRLAEAADGEDLGFPADGAAFDDITDGDNLLAALDTAHQKNRAILRSLSDVDLDKQVTFGSYRYTVEGFLITMFEHRSFHLGQIDLLFRQHYHDPGEFMEWPLAEQVIG